MLSISACLQRAATVVLLCLACAAANAGRAPLTAFDRAERQREALEGRPQQQRTRAAYEHVLEAYRAIYRNEPASREADAAVDAVASLLVEEGRAFHDAKLLHDAIDQYTFLRRTYPASPFRQSALLSEAEISQSDLHDYAAAHQAFSEFLRLYPSSPLAAEARQQLKATRAYEAPQSAALSRLPPQRTLSPTEAAKAEQAARNAAEHAAELRALNAASTPAVDIPAPQKQTPRAVATAGSLAAGPVLITGIRHWSTPIYTRVAIDLSDEVQYEAARVPDPDRIYFDLHGARLAPELVGKSLNDNGNVTDDGFLRRIRVAPYSRNSTRVVLDVSHVSEYSAFFLPNPWRLIIDIHGAKSNTSATTQENASARSTLPPAPPSEPGANGTVREPNAPANTSLSSSDVASLGQQPTRVRATHHPTTGPIAASVNGTRRAQQPNELEALGATPETPSVPANSAAAAPTRTRHKNPSSSNSSVASVPAPVNLSPPASPSPVAPTLSAREAAPTADGQRSLVRALGLKIGRIVIDAGHGGHDSGTLGPEGIQEKDVVLDVALRLGKLLKQRLGADVIYTRDDDTFVPLETRTAIANKAQADLFISVHANSSSDPTARGTEVYYLNFTTSPEALEVAARENAVSDQSIYQLSDLVKKITLKDKIDESHEFASDVEGSLYSGLEAGNEGMKDRGVKKAPFVVLIGANMPSILAEISFLTNPEDARELRDPNYRERIAESLYRGVARYVSGLSGVRLAQSSTRSSRSQ